MMYIFALAEVILKSCGALLLHHSGMSHAKVTKSEVSNDVLKLYSSYTQGKRKFVFCS
jgi:hypothetical protein